MQLKNQFSNNNLNKPRLTANTQTNIYIDLKRKKEIRE
jgi:hypothetical protein